MRRNFVIKFCTHKGVHFPEGLHFPVYSVSAGQNDCYNRNKAVAHVDASRRIPFSHGTAVSRRRRIGRVGCNSNPLFAAHVISSLEAHSCVYSQGKCSELKWIYLWMCGVTFSFKRVTDVNEKYADWKREDLNMSSGKIVFMDLILIIAIGELLEELNLLSGVHFCLTMIKDFEY